MECHSETHPPPLAKPCRIAHPSFSASLIDAIYRSLDGPDSPGKEIPATGTEHIRSKPQINQSQEKKKLQSNLLSAKTKQPPPCNTSDGRTNGFSKVHSQKSKTVQTNQARDNRPTLLPKTPTQEKKKKVHSSSFGNRWREFRKVHRDPSTNSTSQFGNLIKKIFLPSKSSKKKKQQNIIDMGVVQPLGEPVVSRQLLEPILEQEVVEFREITDQHADQNMDADADVEVEVEGVELEMEVVESPEDDKSRCLEDDKFEDDDLSDQSSDLFELENLTKNGSN